MSFLSGITHFVEHNIVDPVVNDVVKPVEHAVEGATSGIVHGIGGWLSQIASALTNESIDRVQTEAHGGIPNGDASDLGTDKAVDDGNDALDHGGVPTGTTSSALGIWHGGNIHPLGLGEFGNLFGHGSHFNLPGLFETHAPVAEPAPAPAPVPTPVDDPIDYGAYVGPPADTDLHIH